MGRLHFTLATWALLLLGAAFSGCTASPPAVSSTSANAAPPVQSSTETRAIANGTTHHAPTWRNVTVQVDFTSVGGQGTFAGFDQPECGAQAGVCELYYHQTLDFADSKTFNGTIEDQAHGHADTDGNIHGAGTFAFTGSIAGCAGTGTATWAYELFIPKQPSVRPDGNVIHGWDNVTALKEYAGFAGLADPRPAGATGPILSAEYFSKPTGTLVGTLTGTIACQAT